MQLQTIDLGRKDYAETFEIQQALNEQVAARQHREVLILVEHNPVITLTARKHIRDHLLADDRELERLGIDVQPTNRGGDITYHGPGQLVAYPIIRLRDHGLNLGGYMRLMEQAVINTVMSFGVDAKTEDGATGVWVSLPSSGEEPSAKLCAMGVRLRRHTTLHGLALNVSTDLSHFATIDPCGLGGRPVTSLKRILGERCPAMAEVKSRLAETLEAELDAQQSVDDRK